MHFFLLFALLKKLELKDKHSLFKKLSLNFIGCKEKRLKRLKQYSENPNNEIHRFLASENPNNEIHWFLASENPNNEINRFLASENPNNEIHRYLASVEEKLFYIDNTVHIV